MFHEIKQYDCTTTYRCYRIRCRRLNRHAPPATKHQVTLFEASDRIGGHTNTITLQKGADAGLKIDTGFIVMNHRNYPLLTKLFESLNVPLQDSDMSFGYHDLPSGLQYCGSGLSGLFAQRKNLFRPRFHRLIKEVFRFFSTASMDASKGLHPGETLGAYLKRNHFSQDFIDHHLIPMGSAIWSTPCEEMMAFPAQSFMNFFKNHGLLGIKDRPQWRTVQRGSCTYIERMQQQWKNVTLIPNAQIEHIRRINDGVEIQRIGNIEFFDQVVIATHADQALKILADPNQLEKTRWELGAMLEVKPTCIPMRASCLLCAESGPLGISNESMETEPLLPIT